MNQRWQIIATTETPEGGKISPQSIIGVWIYEGVPDNLWGFTRSLPLSDAAYVAFTRQS